MKPPPFYLPAVGGGGGGFVPLTPSGAKPAPPPTVGDGNSYPACEIALGGADFKQRFLNNAPAPEGLARFLPAVVRLSASQEPCQRGLRNNAPLLEIDVQKYGI